MKNYYYYDEEQCRFRPIQYSRKEQVLHHISVVIFSGAILSVLSITLLSYWVGSPSEVALKEENATLYSQLQETRDVINEIDEEVNQIAENDNELYRSMLGVDPIPEDERTAGIGGADPYSDFDVFQQETSELIKWTAQNLENLKRRVNIQQVSFAELKEYYNENKEKMDHIPAIKPVNGRVLSGFGMRMHPVLGYERHHDGMDFRARQGTPVYSTADGVVRSASRRGPYGLRVIIDHGHGYQTKYAHLSELGEGIQPGKEVKRGQKIAKSGNTGRTSGPHLHYEVHRDGEPQDPQHYLFGDLTPQEYREYRRIAESNPMSMD